MSWKIEVKPKAEKQYLKLDKKTRKRIKDAIRHLEGEKNSLQHHNVRALTGHLVGDYCLRISDWRILFSPDKKIRSFTFTQSFPEVKHISYI